VCDRVVPVDAIAQFRNATRGHEASGAVPRGTRNLRDIVAHSFELLDRLGYRFTPEQVPEMVDYYLARTSHGSTLSGVVHTWVLARANRDRAMEFFQQALKSDVSDIQGGTTSEGIHLAAMAGTVDLMQRCFTGLETRSNRIILSPHWPEALGVLAIPIHYRGLHLHLRVSGKGVIISVDPRDAAGIEVECHGRVVELMPGTTVRFPG
jgi:trehalose/maltose hydrolase-like predicted phosphorylase